MGLDANINIAMGAIFSFLYLLGIPAFIWFRNREPIRSRGWLISVLQMSAALVDVHMRGEGYYPVGCLADTWRSVCLLPLWIYPYFGRVFVLWFHFNLHNTLLLQQTNTRKGRFIVWVQAHPWLISVWAELVLFVALFLLSTVIALSIYFTGLSEISGSCYLDATYYVNIIQGVLALVLLLGSAAVLWNVNDAYLLKYEFTYLFVVGLPIFIIWAVSAALGWDGMTGEGFWVDLAEVLFFLGTICFPIYGIRRFANLLRKRIASEDNSANGTETRFSTSPGRHYEDVRFVLNDDILLPGLEKFMVQSWAIENLLFLKKAEEYRLATGEARRPMAKTIVEDFIREGQSVFVGLCFLLPFYPSGGKISIIFSLFFFIKKKKKLCGWVFQVVCVRLMWR